MKSVTVSPLRCPTARTASSVDPIPVGSQTPISGPVSSLNSVVLPRRR